VLAVGGPTPVGAAARELRVTLAGGAILLAVVEVLPLVADLVLKSLGSGAGTAGSGESGAVIGLLTLAGTGAVAMRYGVLPFHLRIPRLTDVVPPISLPLLLAWIPLPLAVAGIAAVDNLVAPLALPLDGERAIVIFVASITLIGAALAAFVQDDLRHTTGYLVIADAGILVLAVAALDPAAWGPTRAWVVTLAATKTALAAWAAVTEERFETRSIPDLRGWMRRSPLLAFGLVVTTVATFGLPGWVAFEARDSIAGLVVDGFGAVVLVLLGWLTLPTYLRLIVLGAGRVTSKVDGAAPERFVRGRHGRRAHEERLPVEADSDGASAGAAPTVATAAPRATVAAKADGPTTGTRTATGTMAVEPGAAASGDEVAVDDAGPVPAAGPSRLRGLRTRAGSAVSSAGTSVATAARSGRSAAGTLRTPHADPEPFHERLVAALHRDRAELLAGAVLALALLAALTSWGALDIGGASAEPAPALISLSGD
jgi:hypothetical protein